MKTLNVYTIADVAALLKCSKPTVRTLIRNEKLAAFWVGNSQRVTELALRTFLGDSADDVLGAKQ